VKVPKKKKRKRASKKSDSGKGSKKRRVVDSDDDDDDDDDDEASASEATEYEWITDDDVDGDDGMRNFLASPAAVAKREVEVADAEAAADDACPPGKVGSFTLAGCQSLFCFFFCTCHLFAFAT
jgi:hypothetical protein